MVSGNIIEVNLLSLNASFPKAVGIMLFISLGTIILFLLPL